jgi:DNA-binding NtrC family response regulator
MERMAETQRILIVDDEDLLRTSLSMNLGREGYRVTTAADGDEAINILHSEEFDLILLDIMMPKVDGYDVLKYIKNQNLSTKVVMLTGAADLKNAMDAMALGANDFLSKPFNYVELLGTVKRMLGNR